MEQDYLKDTLRPHINGWWGTLWCWGGNCSNLAKVWDLGFLVLLVLCVYLCEKVIAEETESSVKRSEISSEELNLLNARASKGVSFRGPESPEEMAVRRLSGPLLTFFCAQSNNKTLLCSYSVYQILMLVKCTLYKCPLAVLFTLMIPECTLVLFFISPQVGLLTRASCLTPLVCVLNYTLL